MRSLALTVGLLALGAVDASAAYTIKTASGYVARQEVLRVNGEFIFIACRTPEWLEG